MYKFKKKTHTQAFVLKSQAHYAKGTPERLIQRTLQLIKCKKFTVLSLTVLFSIDKTPQ